MIEEGGRILQEANGVIRGLDPDGRIAANAKHKTAAREATPEEYRLAEVLKELTENVHKTIEQAKKKIAGMPHAKKELNPLWGLLAEPLGQILAAVGLLLSGVLGLVGRLVSPSTPFAASSYSNIHLAQRTWSRRSVGQLVGRAWSQEHPQWSWSRNGHRLVDRQEKEMSCLIRDKIAVFICTVMFGSGWESLRI